MFTELNKEEEPGLNHVHILVDSLAEAGGLSVFSRLWR